MSWLEQKYIGLLSSRLENFKRKGSTLYNFRCPLCGDSEIKKSKARGYIYEKAGKYFFHCHNCGASLNAMNFLKKLDVNLYNQYKLEKMKDNMDPAEVDYVQFINKMKPPAFLTNGVLKKLRKVSQLKENDPVKQFVVKRKIPNEFHAKLFSCPNYMHFVNTLIPEKFSKEALKNDETRLLIPFVNEDGILHAFQGRSLGPSHTKYITIVLNNDIPKVYGLDRISRAKTIFVFEGPIDAMFIDNAIAVAGGEMVSVVSTFNKEKLIMVYDNEPRSKETIDKIQKAIMNGYTVCIWPDTFEGLKDINDMILAGYDSDYLEWIINKNSYHGIVAKLQLKKWSKIQYE